MPRLLLVEDEATLRKSMARGLGKMPSFAVEDVMTVGEAIAAIELNPPDILVSDIDLPDRSGIELLGVLKQQGIDIPVIFVSAYLANFRGEIPTSSSITLLEKPFELEQLREQVRKSLLNRDVHSDRESNTPFAAAGYVELACLGRHSIRVCVTDSQTCGEIIVQNGEVWSAQDWDGQGEDAFMRLILEEDVSCILYEDEDLPRNIHEDARTLIHLARLRQEGKAPVSVVEEQAPKPAVAAISSGKELEKEFAGHWDRGVEALLFKDYATAEQEFAAALKLKPDDPGTRANVERLRELGYPAAEAE